MFSRCCIVTSPISGPHAVHLVDLRRSLIPIGFWRTRFARPPEAALTSFAAWFAALRATNQAVHLPRRPSSLWLAVTRAGERRNNSMDFSGLNFLRYADAILVFCHSEKAAKHAVGTMASILDKQLRLT